MSKANKFANFGKNDKAFTGLEAAIVLIAFVVVAAVFSYVMLGAGFFTSEKSKEVVHTGVAMASSSVQTSGDVIANGSGTTVNTVTITIQLTAGNSPVDLSKTIVSFQDKNSYVAQAWCGNGMAADGSAGTMGTGMGISWINQATPKNTLLEQGEMAQLIIPLNGDNVGANDQISLTVIPPQGATLPISVTVPAGIQSSMALY